MYDFIGSFWPILLLALLIGMAVGLRKKNTFVIKKGQRVQLAIPFFVVSSISQSSSPGTQECIQSVS